MSWLMCASGGLCVGSRCDTSGSVCGADTRITPTKWPRVRRLAISWVRFSGCAVASATSVVEGNHPICRAYVWIRVGLVTKRIFTG